MTAVEWLINELQNSPAFHSQFFKDEFQQAKEMEKQQIIDAYKQGFSDCDDIGISVYDEYYNKTFNK
jgi:hypothetical protein